MKNLKTLLTAAILLPSITMALDSQSQQLLDAKIQQQLQSAKAAAGGAVTIKPVSRELIEKTLNEKLGGKGTVDFGKAGGVIIGSGADGLVATSNTNNGGPIVVAPPVLPSTSITVVGRPGVSQKNSFCILPIVTDAQGNILSAQSYANPKCGELGSPRRTTAGLHLVSFNNSILFITVKAGENRVIPLREISISNSGGNIGFAAYPETCSELELEKHASDLVANGSAGVYRTVTSLKKYLLEYKANNPKALCRGTAPQIIAQGFDGSFFSVLPGVYSISWTIDEQNDSTGNIVVE